MTLNDPYYLKPPAFVNIQSHPLPVLGMGKAYSILFKFHIQIDLGECQHDKLPRQRTSLGPGVHDYISRESLTTRNVLWSPASVCLSVCPRPHAYTIARTRM